MAIGRGGLREVHRALAVTFGVVAFALLATCFDTRSAVAQDWSLNSSLAQRMGYNSNVLLQPDNEISAFSSQTTPALKLSRAGPSSDMSLEGRFPYTAYFGHSELNRADQFGKLKVSKALSERSLLGFDANIAHDTTIESDSSDSSDTSDKEDTGRFVANPVRFLRWDATPSWQYLLSPIDRLRLSATYQQTDYDSREKTDYRDYGPTISYTHDLSELASVFGSLDYSRFEPDDDVNTVQDVYGGLVGYDYHPTERFSISGAAGLNYNVTHSDDQDSSGEIGYRFQFTMNYEISERTNANLQLSRDTEPTGDGEARTRNRGTFGISYKMTEMTVFSLDGSYLDDQKTQSNNQVSRRFTIKPSVTWDITEDLSLQASYQFRYKTFESSGSAMDNAAFITLRYALPDLHWSGF
jgi:hypothetical protein